MAKQKKCKWCEETVDKLWFSSPPTCMKHSCRSRGDAERKAKKGEKSSPVYSSIKQKKREPTGELKLFLEIYSERKGICEVTGEQIKFNVNNFAHILSKGAYGKYRLNPFNIAHVKPEIHHLYDNRGKEALLSNYPEAEVIYERKERLKQQYYQESKN